jgi:DNA recombination protein Rad52
MSKTKEQMIEELNAKIPRDVVSERQGSGGKSFSYLTGHYVIDLLNKIFGQGNWSYLVEHTECVHSGNDGKTNTVHYIARGRLEVPVLGSMFTDVGYGDGSDKFNIGKAHELAIKEAATDAFKRCARNLGMATGLALYDKEQSNVDDGEELKAVSQGPKRVAGPVAVAAGSGKPAGTVSAPVGSGIPEAAPEDREELNKLISSLADVVGAKAGSKKAAKMQELIGLMRKKYNVKKKEDLTYTQAAEFYKELREQANG